MRFSTASVALLAGVVAAIPQASIQPISQISDGQIQAPPATSVVPAPSELPSVVPTVGPIVSESVVVPSVVVPTATPIAPTSLVVPIVPGVNSTAPVAGTSVAPSSSGASTPTSSASTSASAPESSGGAASGNFISFGGLVFAVAAAVFA